MMGNLERDRNKLIAWAMLLYLGLRVCCQQCGGPCQCTSVPVCPERVPLILDGCQCCSMCARQQGEACTERFLCDIQRGLQCDYSASFPDDPGECVSQKELGCEHNGVFYQEGQVFQPSCALQCRCSGGGVACVPQCREDVLLPTPDCPHPRRVQPPGKCCKEWVCENMDNTVLEDALIATASRTEQSVPANFGAFQTRPSSNCVDRSSEWSACSQTCGPGISTRVSNQNPACRLEMQIRLCTIRPCPSVLHRTPQGSRRKCQPSYRSARPLLLFHQGCYSTRFYRPHYCGLCTDNRCCTPHHTGTMTVTFRCPGGRMFNQAVMTINSCRCHYNCPSSAIGTYRGTSFWG
ncbi:WNT1-inducible-signaling pathway protein 2 [Triplophysa rosa]|uniref:WNT1-inducible-signaling pathway protein 2 n=1 Tax=Triplophysa rosa TaxID=992332 RepID=A0A9W7T974_TRIRA|nr:WNT1-inducible-signaling pathway protein 2 [Triplophysa rosa]KAI7794170.1 WNT1-inducible-signaling pathway protein 2 precursor [Triplophysa rosa]